MTFNPQRAEALRSAIHNTVYWLQQSHFDDTHKLLTEHLALLQEAELIYLTDAFVSESSIGVDESRVPQDGRAAQGFNATGEDGRIVDLHESIFPDISELERAAGRVSLRKSFGDPHAELRKTWAPGQRWQVRAPGNRNWGDLNGKPSWSCHLEYRRHPDDVDQPDEPEWVDWAGWGMPVKRGTPIKVKHRSGHIYTTVAGGCYACRWAHDDMETDIVAYKLVR